MAPVRRSDDEARDADDELRFGPAATDKPEEAAVGMERGVDSSHGSTVDVREVPEGHSAPKSRAQGCSCVGPCTLLFLRCVCEVRGNNRRSPGCRRQRRDRKTATSGRRGRSRGAP